MRLIDADALKKSLEKLWNVHDDQDFANKDVWREIENAPTVEPERTAKVTLLTPDSKSYWSTNGRCQGCGFLLERKYAYCPNCGAKLDWSE